MAITATRKFGLVQWGNSATDGPTMQQFNAALLQLDTNAAYDFQGAGLGLRPAAGVVGRWYTDTTAKITYRDNGITWVAIASSALDILVTNSTTATVTQRLTGQAGTTADLTQWSVSGRPNGTAKIDSNGKLTVSDINGTSVTTIGDPLQPIRTDLNATSNTSKGVVVNAASSFGGVSLQEWDVNGTPVATISKSGAFKTSTVEALTSLISDSYTSLSTGTVYQNKPVLDIFGGANASNASPVNRFRVYDNGGVSISMLDDGNFRTALSLASNNGPSHAVETYNAGANTAYLSHDGTFVTQANLQAVGIFSQYLSSTGNATINGTLGVGVISSANPATVGYPTVNQHVATAQWVFDQFYARGIYGGQPRSTTVNRGGGSNNFPASVMTGMLTAGSPSGIAGWYLVAAQLTLASTLRSYMYMRLYAPNGVNISNDKYVIAEANDTTTIDFVDTVYLAAGGGTWTLQAQVGSGTGTVDNARTKLTVTFIGV